MNNDRRTGVALGLLVCAVAVAGNMLRAAPHLVSVYPDLLSMAIAPIVIYIMGRRRRLRGEFPEAVTGFGLRAGAVAGGVFAIGLALFTVYRTVGWPLWVFAGTAAFGSVFLLSGLAAYAAAHTRITAV